MPAGLRPFFLQTVLGAGLSLLSLAATSPARSLDLTSSGWTISPATPGECRPLPVIDYGCYENRTAISIDLIGLDSASPAGTTYSYNLPSGANQQQVSFTYFFDPDGNSDSFAYYQIGSSSAVSFSASMAGSVLPFTWSPGETLTFGVDQGSSSAWAGKLSISAFSSTEMAQSAPAPLPLAGAAAAFGWSRSLRRRIRPLQ